MAKGNYNKCETMRKITSLFFLILILFSFTSCTRPHICICKKKAISNEYLYKASTGCNDSSIYYYSCECGKIGSETFMWTPAHTNGILKDICMDNEEGLKNCGLFYCEACKASYHKEIEYSDINIPIVSLKTDINNISKNEKSYTKFSYDGEKKFIKDATIKLQGASSTGYPKKNFSIQLFEPNTNLTKKFKVELKSGWGKESKYCLKANCYLSN